MGNSYKAALSQNRGENGEAIARAALIAMGYANIKKGRGRWVVAGWIDRANMIARVAPDPNQKDWGDWQAIEPHSGRAVWAEVKTAAGRLPYSRIKKHQAAGMLDHGSKGGIALLLWVDPESMTIYALNWPIPGFDPGTALTPEIAAPNAVYMAHVVDLLVGAAAPSPLIYGPNGAALETAAPRPPTWQKSGEAVCPECNRGHLIPIASPYGGGKILCCDYCNIGTMQSEADRE